MRIVLTLKSAFVLAVVILAFARAQTQETFDRQFLKERGALSVAQQTTLNHSDNDVKLRVGWKLTSRAPRNAG